MFLIKVLMYAIGGNSYGKAYIALCILFLLVYMAFSYGNKYKWRIKSKGIFVKEGKSILFIFFTYAVLSTYAIIKNKGSLHTETIYGFWHIVFPVLTAYFILNLSSNADIDRMMRYTFWICFIIYFILIVLPFIYRGEAFTCSWRDSYSPLESTFFSYFALGYSMYFSAIGDKKKYKYLSLIFVILTFKRFMIIAAFFLFLFGEKLKEKETKKTAWIAFTIAMLLMCLLYIAMMYGYLQYAFAAITGKNFDAFTMSRAVFLRTVVKAGYCSEGFCSSKYWIQQIIVGEGRGHWSIESDLPSVYLEMGIAALVITVVCLCNLAKKNQYNMVLIFICIVQLLTSAWFDYPFFWILMYLTIGNINTNEKELIKVKRGRKKLAVTVPG